ncbi:hypothetical protein [Spirillospora sp. NPDC048819]|uniref:hypothetical protein n=1 Tax=Spirillospora sp. NPDC048819 TaxID=3155268 RepID=UPI0033C25E7D
MDNITEMLVGGALKPIIGQVDRAFGDGLDLDERAQRSSDGLAREAVGLCRGMGVSRGGREAVRR